MGYSPQVIRRATARLESARQAHDYETDQRIGDIYRRFPRLKEIDLLLRQTVAKVMAANYRAGGKAEDAVAQIRVENMALQQERQWILESENIDLQDLEKTPICSNCKGSGYLGAVMCECLHELCRQEQKKDLSSMFSGHISSFENFKLEYYPTEVDRTIGMSPRQLMEMVFQMSKQYAANFSTKSPSLLFTGGTGLGKTMLSGAIARTVSDRGYSVSYETAGKVFSDFEAEKFNGVMGITDKYLSCDLLIMDDLGTEMTTQFTQSALYSIINGRIMASLPTVISSNLSGEEIGQRYSPQIASRLLGYYTMARFVGKDIRFMK
ncbi:MAG: ATP-binding protein [Eubacteriales bacterium]